VIFDSEISQQQPAKLPPMHSCHHLLFVNAKIIRQDKQGKNLAKKNSTTLSAMKQHAPDSPKADTM
jgi:hypothetical protein